MAWLKKTPTSTSNTDELSPLFNLYIKESTLKKSFGFWQEG